MTSRHHLQTTVLGIAPVTTRSAMSMPGFVRREFGSPARYPTPTVAGARGSEPCRGCWAGSSTSQSAPGSLPWRSARSTPSYLVRVLMSEPHRGGRSLPRYTSSRGLSCRALEPLCCAGRPLRQGGFSIEVPQPIIADMSGRTCRVRVSYRTLPPTGWAGCPAKRL